VERAEHLTQDLSTLLAFLIFSAVIFSEIVPLKDDLKSRTRNRSLKSGIGLEQDDFHSTSCSHTVSLICYKKDIQAIEICEVSQVLFTETHITSIFL
jgi:hypothetical protein